MSSRSAEDHYSEKCEESESDRIKREQEDLDFLAEFTQEKINELQRAAYARSLDPLSEAEIGEMMAALDAGDPPADGAVHVPAPEDAEWLADFKALATKHRPFSSAQVVEIVRTLHRANDPTIEAGQ